MCDFLKILNSSRKEKREINSDSTEEFIAEKPQIKKKRNFFKNFKKFFVCSRKKKKLVGDISSQTFSADIDDETSILDRDDGQNSARDSSSDSMLEVTPKSDYTEKVSCEKGDSVEEKTDEKTFVKEAKEAQVTEAVQAPEKPKIEFTPKDSDYSFDSDQINNLKRFGPFHAKGSKKMDKKYLSEPSIGKISSLNEILEIKPIKTFESLLKSVKNCQNVTSKTAKTCQNTIKKFSSDTIVFTGKKIMVRENKSKQMRSQSDTAIVNIPNQLELDIEMLIKSIGSLKVALYLLKLYKEFDEKPTSAELKVNSLIPLSLVERRRKRNKINFSLQNQPIMVKLTTDEKSTSAQRENALSNIDDEDLKEKLEDIPDYLIDKTLDLCYDPIFKKFNELAKEIKIPTLNDLAEQRLHNESESRKYQCQVFRKYLPRNANTTGAFLNESKRYQIDNSCTIDYYLLLWYILSTRNSKLISELKSKKSNNFYDVIKRITDNIKDNNWNLARLSWAKYIGLKPIGRKSKNDLIKYSFFNTENLIFQIDHNNYQKYSYECPNANCFKNTSSEFMLQRSLNKNIVLKKKFCFGCRCLLNVFEPNWSNNILNNGQPILLIADPYIMTQIFEVPLKEIEIPVNLFIGKVVYKLLGYTAGNGDTAGNGHFILKLWNNGKFEKFDNLDLENRKKSKDNDWQISSIFYEYFGLPISALVCSKIDDEELGEELDDKEIDDEEYEEYEYDEDDEELGETRF